jgi:MFS family permease
MEKFLKVPPTIVNGLMMGAVASSAVFYVVFGWLSDKVGRKLVMLSGVALMLVAYFPAFHLLSQTLNPALADAQARTPVVVVADPADCSLQFDPVGKSAFVTSCDLAKSTLANAGVSYENRAAPAGAVAEVMVGETKVVSTTAKGLPKAQAAKVKADVDGRIHAALAAAGYPDKADPARMNLIGAFSILLVFVIAACALYGPLAATLVELFPTKIRYTAMSLPYHIGTGWIGGFVPFTSFAIVAAVGDIYSGLWFPVSFTAVALVVGLIFLPETKDRSIED